MMIRKIPDNKDGTSSSMVLIRRAETETMALGYVAVNQGESTVTGLHHDEEEIFIVLKGEGVLLLGDEEQAVCAGDTVYVPRSTAHKMTCTSAEKLEYLYCANWPAQKPEKPD